MKKILTSFVLVICFIFVSAFTACGGTAKIESISITKMPQTEYVVGDQLNLEGGELTATYSDDSTQVISLTASAVTVQRPIMTTAGTKTVSVIYQSKSTQFTITVSEPKINITFDLNYEGSQNWIVGVDSGESVNLPEVPVREGYAFLGWYVGKGTSSRYNFDTAITASVTIYAHWGYSVEFDLNYKNSENAIENVEIGATVSRPANPVYEGHIFTGWYSDKECKTEYDFNAAINANIVIYAGWREVSGETIYTVTFELNDGAGSTIERQVVSGETVDQPNTPVLDGATFAGWYADEGLTEAFDFSNTITSNVTVYAKWDVENYIITFHYNHENNDGVYQTVSIPDIEGGWPVSKPDDPILNGYYFAGWYMESECTTQATFPVDLREYKHYYAKWLKEWEFQAEYTDFGNREAFGYSANGTGASAFIMHNNAEAAGAHNGYWVANLHNQGLYVEFCITSLEEVFDAALVLRLSADFYDITLNSRNFGITVNGETINYDFEAVITGAVGPDQGGIQNKRPFDNWTFLTDLHLKKGENVIRFTMLDNQRYGEVGTMYATAPMMDSMYIMTNATLSWTAPFPMTDNV